MNRSLRLPEAVAPTLGYLTAQRRRLGIWVMDTGSANTLAARSFAAKYDLCHIDVLLDLINYLTDDSEKPLGVFGPDDLAEWIQRKSYLFTLPLVVSEVESILATFGKPGAIGFFRLTVNLDLRLPVVIIVHLADLVNAAGFPEDRTWHITV